MYCKFELKFNTIETHTCKLWNKEQARTGVIDMLILKAAFLLTNPDSDLVDPDCLNVHASWKKNLKKIKTTTRGLGTELTDHVI